MYIDIYIIIYIYTCVCACAMCVYTVLIFKMFNMMQYYTIGEREREREGVKELAKTSRKSVCGSLRVPCPDMNHGQE